MQFAHIKKLRIGTRRSNLALVQSNWVKLKLKEKYPDLEVELIEIVTQGDRIQDKPLYEVGGKGLFLKEIEEALLDRRVDIAVHSMKDVPADNIKDLVFYAIPERMSPFDALISKNGEKLDNLVQKAKIGTGSLRRTSQLKAFRQDFNIVPVRGNVDTRLQKLKANEFDAIILAEAGIARLGAGDCITQVLSAEILIPAVGQGALGIQGIKDNLELKDLLAFMNDNTTATAVTAERALLKELDGGCKIPVAGYAFIRGGVLHLEGMVGNRDGSEIIRERLQGSPADADSIGKELAKRLFKRGAAAILAQFYGN